MISIKLLTASQLRKSLIFQALPWLFFADATDRHKSIDRLKISTTCSVRRKLSRTLFRPKNFNRIDFIFKIHPDYNFLSQAHIKVQYFFFFNCNFYKFINFNSKILNRDAGLNTRDLRNRHTTAKICKNILLNNIFATTMMEQIPY